MITSRSLLLISFLALLSGCTTSPCVAPKELSQTPLQHCYYQLQVIKIEMSNNRTFITGKVPDVLYDKGEGEDFRAPSPGKEFTFPVTSLATLGPPVKENDGKTYEFVRHGNSNEFELVDELTRNQKK